jgi:nicotinate phosphoribosyltransferase
VYKLSVAGDKPRIKLSENVGKITLPHRKQVFRILDNDGNFAGADAITMIDETDIEIMHHPLFPLKSLSVKKNTKEPLLHKIMENGTRVTKPFSLKEIAEYSKERLKKLPSEYKRFNYPHLYKVGLSDKLRNERDKLITEYKK